MKKMNKPASRTPPSQAVLGTQLEPQQLQIISNLRKLSDSLSAFQRCFSELQQHIDSVRSSIDFSITLLLPHQLTPPLASAEPETKPEPELSIESDPSEDEDEEEEEVKSPCHSELEILCEMMNSLGLHKYMVNHLSDIDTLRDQVPKAFKLCPNPGKLVLHCIPKFYIQGNKGYVNSSRGLASLLALECFLLMMGEVDGVVEIEKFVKHEAERAALAWLKRMISEGGIVKAHEMDARGLLFLIGCFGIPKRFRYGVIKDLVLVSRVNGGAIKKSSLLMGRIPKVIDWMVNHNNVGAVDVAYTFGMVDRFNPRTLLTSFLHESEVSLLNNIKGLEQGIAMRAAKKKYLFNLISVMQCLERHKIDHSKLLPGWQIDVRIMNLEKEIDELNTHIAEKKLAELTKNIGDQKMALKRKNDETDMSDSFSNKEMKSSYFLNQNPWPPQQQRVVDIVENRNNTLLEGGGTAGHTYGYSLSASVLNGPVASSIHESVVGSLAGHVGGVAIGGLGVGISASANGIHVGTDFVLQGGSYAGGHGGSRVDSSPGQMGSHAGQLYGSRAGGGVYDTLPPSHIYSCRPSSYLEGPNTIAGDAFRPPPYMESSKGLPNIIPCNANKPAPYLESSAPEPEPSMESDPFDDEDEEEEDDEEEVRKEEKEEEVKSPPRSELEILCETMNSQGLLNYMIRRLFEIKTLKQKVPGALKLSPNPASFVLECTNKFYLQPSNAFVKGSPLISERWAKVLLLEFFLKMMGEELLTEIEKCVKDDAEQAALAWLERMNSEGGVLKAEETDARGLLLFIGCFGIPLGFTNEDIRRLLHVSNVMMISGSLRRSSFLLTKVPEIIEWMLKQNMVVGTVDIAYTFGMQDIFDPQRLLTSFLQESEESLLKKIKGFEQMKGSEEDSLIVATIDAKREYLAGLKSIIQCLGRHGIDHSELLPRWQIDTKMMSLRKEIAQFRTKLKGDQKMAQKRKVDDSEWSNKEVKCSHFSNPWPPQQRVISHVNSNNTLLEGGGTVGGVPMGGSGAGRSSSANGIHAVAGVVLRGGSHAGGHGGSPVNSTPRQMESPAGQLYGLHCDAAVYDTLPSHRYVYRPSSYLEGPNAGDACKPASYVESSKGSPNTIPGDANRPLPHLEGCTGLPNIIPPPYQFAATVPGTEVHQRSGSQAVDAHPSPYLYFQR